MLQIEIFGRSFSKGKLVTCCTRLTTLSTRSTCLLTNSTGLSNRSTHLSTCSNRLSIRSTCLTTRSICLSTCSIRIYLSVFWRLCEHLWIENSKLCLTNAAHERFITQTGKKLKTVFENIMGPGDRGAEGRHMRPRAEGREKQLLWKKQGNAIKSKLTITTSLEKFVISRRFGHFLSCIATKKCYFSGGMLSLIWADDAYFFKKLKLSLFPYWKFLNSLNTLTGTPLKYCKLLG